jgi:hypothetical protein
VPDTRTSMRSKLNDLQHVSKKIGDLLCMPSFTQKLLLTISITGASMISPVLLNIVKQEGRIRDLLDVTLILETANQLAPCAGTQRHAGEKKTLRKQTMPRILMLLAML